MKKQIFTHGGGGEAKERKGRDTKKRKRMAKEEKVVDLPDT